MRKRLSRKETAHVAYRLGVLHGVGSCPILLPLALSLTKAAISTAHNRLLSPPFDPISNNRGPPGSTLDQPWADSRCPMEGANQ